MFTHEDHGTLFTWKRTDTSLDAQLCVQACQTHGRDVKTNAHVSQQLILVDGRFFSYHGA